MEDQRGGGQGQERNPVILLAVVDIDVTHVAKPIGYAGVDEHDGLTEDGNAEASSDGSPHELSSEHHFPANLEVKGNGADETCAVSTDHRKRAERTYSR